VVAVQGRVVELTGSTAAETGVLKNGVSMRGALVEDEIYFQGEGGLVSRGLLVAEADTEATLPSLPIIVAETDIDLAPNLIEGDGQAGSERALDGQSVIGSDGDDVKHVLGGISITFMAVLVRATHRLTIPEYLNIAILSMKIIGRAA